MPANFHRFGKLSQRGQIAIKITGVSQIETATIDCQAWKPAAAALNSIRAGSWRARILSADAYFNERTPSTAMRDEAGHCGGQELIRYSMPSAVSCRRSCKPASRSRKETTRTSNCATRVPGVQPDAS